MFSLPTFLTTRGQRLGIAAELLWVYRGEPFHEPGWTDDLDVSSSVFLVEAGEVLLGNPANPMRVHPGDLFLGVEGRRRQSIDPEARLLSVGYEFRRPNGRPVFCDGLPRILPANRSERGAAGQLVKSSFALLKQIHGQPEISFTRAIWSPSRDPADWLRRQTAFLPWLEALLALFAEEGISPNLPSVRSDIVREVKAVLDTHPIDQSFASALAASTQPVGRRRVQQLFREELHLTPQQYFSERRQHYARERLQDQAISPKVVAAELGFRSLAAFSRWFFNGNSMSPREFQRGGAGPSASGPLIDGKPHGPKQND